MTDLIPYYFFSIVIVLIYVVCTLVNLWCLFVMAFLVFDVWFLDRTILLFNKTRAFKRRRKFKIIKGQKGKD